MTKAEIIKETVDYYCNHERAVQGSDCVYETQDKRKCAHSRCVKERYLKMIIKEHDNNASAKTVITSFGDEIHYKRYQGHEISFWLDIQDLHDYSSNWEKNNDGKNVLTKDGENFVNLLLLRYEK